MSALVQSLFDGPLDVIGDVHGEIDALRSLMRHLGYSEEGRHREGRRLVFVGDLTDRGPDSPSVVDLVQRLIDDGRAQCVLGNHDLNILLGAQKHDNHWFFGDDWKLQSNGEPNPAVFADQEIRDRVLTLFKSLPLALERNDLRVVHACWDEEMIEIARSADDVRLLHEQYASRIEVELAGTVTDEAAKNLVQQNRNPVKVLTSGKERRAAKPFPASGKMREEERVPWWNEYQGSVPCFFGHYAKRRGEVNLASRAVCLDFAVAYRWQERRQPSFDGQFQGLLGAMRFPEWQVVFDNGDVETPTTSNA